MLFPSSHIEAFMCTVLQLKCKKKLYDINFLYFFSSVLRIPSTHIIVTHCMPCCQYKIVACGQKVPALLIMANLRYVFAFDYTSTGSKRPLYLSRFEMTSAIPFKWILNCIITVILGKICQTEIHDHYVQMESAVMLDRNASK